MADGDRAGNRYAALVERIFFDPKYGGYKPGRTTVPFRREHLEQAAADLKIALPKNLGDAIYAMRFRTALPRAIVATEPVGKVWSIDIVGRSRYAFVLRKESFIAPRADRATIDIPDATPEIIRAYAQTDEQALLAVVRYNRLIDIFLGVAAYSLQNHLRSTVSTGAQMEIDELYVAVDKLGTQFAIPVQAKGGKDKLSGTQARQDILWCAENMPGAACRAVSCQFLKDGRVAMFELALRDDEVKVVDERHYRLVAENGNRR